MVVESHDDLRHKNLFYIKTLYIYNVFSYPRIILTRPIFESRVDGDLLTEVILEGLVEKTGSTRFGSVSGGSKKCHM